MNSQPSPWAKPPLHLPLGINDVHVWRAALDQHHSAVRAFYKLLSDDERERAARFYFQRDQESFIVARGVLRSIIGRYLLVEPAKVDFCYGLHGKPELSEDLGSGPLCFNVSHAHELALFAFTLNRELGVDLEYIREDLADEDIAEKFFSPTEVKMLRELPASERTQGFFNCWTRKEAYLKANGGGLSVPLNLFAVSLAPGEPAVLLFDQDLSREVTAWTLNELSPGSGYVAAIAVSGHSSTIACWQWPDS